MKNKTRTILTVAAVALLLLALFLLLRNITVEDIVNFTPDNLILAALVLWGIYCAKNLLMFIPILALYLAAGLLFPVGWALVVTWVGLAMEFTIGFFVGRRMGAEKVRAAIEKRPKAQAFFNLLGNNDMTACFLCRLIPMPVPLDLMSMFFGASGVSYPVYILFSLLGISGMMIPFVVAGQYIATPLTPEFLIPLGISLGICLVLMAVSLLLSRRAKAKENSAAEKSDTDGENGAAEETPSENPIDKDSGPLSETTNSKPGGGSMKRRTGRRVAAFLRVGLVALVVLAQVAVMALLTYYLRSFGIYIYLLIEVAALIQIMVMISRNRNSSYTMAWIIIIMLLPVFGYILYMLWGRSDVMGKRPKKIRAAIRRGSAFLDKDPAVYQALARQYPRRKRFAGYLGRKGFPLYGATSCRYFPQGELQFEAMIKDMKQAEKFIFISTFILDTGRLWDEISAVLLERAAAGVEVRLMFDDFGSVLTIPDGMLAYLEHRGVKVVRYNPIHQLISRLYIHYRNHQKITVIDGDIGYTGGTNIADEYANYYEKHGHWKDTAIRLEGDAVWSLTVNFLEMWEAEVDQEQDYLPYRPSQPAQPAEPPDERGFFQPFFDGPVNNPDNPAEAMYRLIISNSREYVYITTPYLVINNNMTDALCTMAQAGVDVRIITPKKWDHWYVHAVSRSNYKPLLQAGVRVFEYTPGFIHAKTILSDGDHCVTGTINMDYRSFYLHFENGVWICGDPVLNNIKEDFDDTFALSEEVTLEDYLGRPLMMRFLEGFLRIFAILF